jgi:UDPglucose 6-dehydrogenase
MSALEASAASIIVTEWKEFYSTDFETIKTAMKNPICFNGVNMCEPTKIVGYIWVIVLNTFTLAGELNDG